MNDKNAIIEVATQHAAGIAKMVFPRMPIQALQVLIRFAVNNAISNHENMLQFLFDKDGNLPAPNEFWEVLRCVFDDKPLVFTVYKETLKIDGKDIDQIREAFEKAN